MRWIDYIVQALENLDGEAKYQDIYEEVRKLKEKDRIKLSTHWKAIIKGRIENHCEEVDGYIEGYPSLFYPPEGKGKGVWALSNDALSILNKRYKTATHKWEINKQKGLLV